MSGNVVYLCPLFDGLAQLAANGALAQNANIYTYLAGTTTDADTYTDGTGATLNPNPIQVGSNGRLPNQIWLLPGQYTKFEIYDQTGVRLSTQDYVIGTDDPSMAQGSVQSSAQVAVLGQAYNQANIAYNTASVANALAQTAGQDIETVYAAINVASNTTSVYANSIVIANAANVNFINSTTVNVKAESYDGAYANVGFEINLSALGKENLANSVANNGWANLSSNVLMQWGVVDGIAFAAKSRGAACPGNANATITFSKTFRSNVLSVQLVAFYANGNIPRIVGAPTTTGMTVYLEYPNAQLYSNTGASAIWWQAIGDQ